MFHAFSIFLHWVWSFSVLSVKWSFMLFVRGWYPLSSSDAFLYCFFSPFAQGAWFHVAQHTLGCVLPTCFSQLTWAFSQDITVNVRSWPHFLQELHSGYARPLPNSSLRTTSTYTEGFQEGEIEGVGKKQTLTFLADCKYPMLFFLKHYTTVWANGNKSAVKISSGKAWFFSAIVNTFFFFF